MTSNIENDQTAMQINDLFDQTAAKIQAVNSELFEEIRRESWAETLTAVLKMGKTPKHIHFNANARDEDDPNYITTQIEMGWEGQASYSDVIVMGVQSVLLDEDVSFSSFRPIRVDA